MKKKSLRIILSLALCMIVMTSFSVTAFAAGDVAGAIEQTWNTAKGQVQTVVNNVVFPVIDMILAILFFVKVGTSYFEYRKHGQFEFAAPCILFACLIFTLTAPVLSIISPSNSCASLTPIAMSGDCSLIAVRTEQVL